MQIDTNLKAPFSYSLVPILCLLLVLFVCLFVGCSSGLKEGGIMNKDENFFIIPSV